MNNQRRKTIMEISRKIELAMENLKDVLDEEQDAFYNMPEGLQASEKGINSEEAQDCLDSAIGLLEDAIDALEEIT